MSEVTPPNPVFPTAGLSREKKQEDKNTFSPAKRSGAYPTSYDQGSGHGDVDSDDAASVMGISEGELTPDVRRAISSLMTEVDALRHKLSQSKERENYFAEMADKDPVFPVLNHRAFIREVTRFLSQKMPEGIQHCLLYLNVTNGDQIKADHGYMCIEGALIHVALLLKAELRETDILGNLSGTDFGVILTVSNREGAREKAQQLNEIIRTRPFSWVGKLITIETAAGVHVLRTGETPEKAIEAADMAARKQILEEND
ncbi:MAG: GGDEF domain-containing protein [Alphaproteobacteria bacterium]|nr:GGDEF domain-containing protein [Rhodospirillales bacterium]MCW9045791.1 GGDEF domain-containing protein [Alphaproteobacteria bacterium]